MWIHSVSTWVKRALFFPILPSLKRFHYSSHYTCENEAECVSSYGLSWIQRLKVLLKLKLEVSRTLWGTYWKSNFPHKENNHKDSDSLETQTAAFSGLAANHTDNHGNSQFHRPSNSNTSKHSSAPSIQVLLLQLKISRHNIINNIGRLNTGKKRADGLRTLGIEEWHINELPGLPYSLLYVQDRACQKASALNHPSVQTKKLQEKPVLPNQSTRETADLQ